MLNNKSTILKPLCRLYSKSQSFQQLKQALATHTEGTVLERFTTFSEVLVSSLTTFINNTGADLEGEYQIVIQQSGVQITSNDTQGRASMPTHRCSATLFLQLFEDDNIVEDFSLSVLANFFEDATDGEIGVVPWLL